MKKALAIILGVIVVLVIAVIAIPRFIDWDSYKPRISAAVKNATGRELRIEGGLQVSIFPNLEVGIERVSLSNAPGSLNPDMLSVESIKAKMELFPLLSRNLVIDSLVVKGPKVFVEVDKSGKSNWAVGAPSVAEPTPPPQPAPPESSGAMPLSGLRLGDVRLEGGEVAYSDAMTGQALHARDISLSVALPDPQSPFTFKGRMILNDEPVDMEASLDSFGSMFAGKRFKVLAVLDSKPIKVHCDGAMQEQPTPSMDGTLTLDVPSIRALAMWLNEPRGRSQADPGPLKVSVKVDSEGKLVTIREASIQSKGIQASATGKYDATGDIAQLVLDVKGESLDFDRYLPPPSPRAKENASRPEGKASLSSLPGPISNEPFDLSGLRKTEAHVSVALGGVRAAGISIGVIDLTATIKDSVLAANLKELGLYGGIVKGSLKLDASQDVLGLDSSLSIDHVKVDELTRLMTDGQPPATGVASGSLSLKANGASPRALLESAVGRGSFTLASGAGSTGQAGMLSDFKADFELPGMEKPPTLRLSAVYNREKVDVDVKPSPLKEALSAHQFEVKATVVSRPITIEYGGKVQTGPVPGLDGTVDLNVPSVGRLAAWVGQPLSSSQPDPGPFKVHALLKADGAKVTIKEAEAEGRGVKAKAEGSFDGSKPIALLKANVDIAEADVDAYLPSTGKGSHGGSKGDSGARSAGWSEVPFDFTSLSKANGEVRIGLGSVRYRGLAISKGQIALALSDGVLKTSIEKLAISGGEIALSSTLETSGGTASLELKASVEDTEALPILKAFADNDRISGRMFFHAQGKARGHSEKELIQSLDGSGDFKFLNGAIHGINLAATLRKAKTLGLGSTAGEVQKTDFAQLSGSFTIKNGVLENRDLTMLAPLVRLKGGGRVPLPPRALDYEVTATLVPTLEGQGGQNALAGLPIPVTIQGSWSDPKYGVDYESVFREAAKDPERLKNMPNDLRQMGGKYGVDLSMPGKPGAQGVGEAFKSLPGLPTGGGATDSQTQAKEKPSPDKKGGPLKSLKGLFGK